MNNIKELISIFLDESTHLIENIEIFSNDSIIDCYNLLQICSKSSCENIGSLDTSLRVKICRYLELHIQKASVYCNKTFNSKLNAKKLAFELFR